MFSPAWHNRGLAAHGQYGQWSGRLLSAVPLGDILSDVLQLVIGAPPSSLMDRHPRLGRSIGFFFYGLVWTRGNMEQYGFV